MSYRSSTGLAFHDRPPHLSDKITSRVLIVASVVLSLSLVGTASPAPVAHAFPAEIQNHVTLPATVPYAAGIDRLDESVQARWVATVGNSYADAAGWEGSLPSKGEGRILALRVSFPMGETEGAGPLVHEEGDTLRNFQSAIGQHVDGTPSEGEGVFPYDNLERYYMRSSYGQLHITGDVYDYEARLPRDRYEGHLTSLFCEALRALDPQVDYANYDGDGDGVIDCVCMRPAGSATEQDSDWWSHAFHATTTGSLSPSWALSAPSFDGKALDSLIVLHRNVGMVGAIQTLLHETGHAMGLPDYYTKLPSTTPSNGIDASLDGDDEGAEEDVTPGGIRTHDMMNDNIGDHNGYSKWMLGWIPDDQIIKVTCDINGNATAMCGGQSLPTSSDNGHVTLSLGTLSGDDDESIGRIIAIYPQEDDGRLGPLSDFYLLQYVSYTGNQQIYGTPQQEASIFDDDLSCGGFQMFRVQGRLAGDGSPRLGHSNTGDPKYDQLIEIVNPSEHRDGSKGAALGASVGYGCFSTPNPNLAIIANATFDGIMWNGREITPHTFPSTNFHENLITGRTGIHVKVVQTQSMQGVVDIWYE